jgi:hypothetical protein
VYDHLNITIEAECTILVKWIRMRENVKQSEIMEGKKKRKIKLKVEREKRKV